MFATLVLFGGKVWKHKGVELSQTRKENRRKLARRVRQTDAFLRKYNDNPHNTLPKKHKWMLTPPPTPQPDVSVRKIPKNLDVINELKKIKDNREK